MSTDSAQRTHGGRASETAEVSSPASHEPGDLLAAFDALIALGGTLPAPGGSRAFLVSVTEAGDAGPHVLGIASSIEAGHRLIAAHARRVWNWDSGTWLRQFAPWMTPERYAAAAPVAFLDAHYLTQSARAAEQNAAAVREQLRLEQRDWFASHDDLGTANAYMRVMSAGFTPDSWSMWITEFTVTSTTSALDGEPTR